MATQLFHERTPLLWGCGIPKLPAFCARPNYEFELCESHEHVLLPAALASVSLGLFSFEFEFTVWLPTSVQVLSSGGPL